MGQCHRLRGGRLSEMDKRKTTAAGSTGKENHVASAFLLKSAYFKAPFKTPKDTLKHI